MVIWHINSSVADIFLWGLGVDEYFRKSPNIRFTVLNNQNLMHL